jgi:hypothetical protein
MSKCCSDPEVLKEWVRSNGMTVDTTIKELPNGKFVALRADGKILKGPAYQKANL